ncbi:hypothetical protein [Robertkochia aurantiaca]|uniref:hypothetical protein n=1 Tax=Robertkochia aurantiaca TaxID=2873700 RepID=UPI001CCC9DC2|nr:hypothetical protein [Robertkochia sp. 3YJGBD-33]
MLPLSMMPGDPSLPISLTTFVLFLGFAFLIGYVAGRVFMKNRYRQQLDKCLVEKSMLLNTLKNEECIEYTQNSVRAVQTRGRSGKMMQVEKPEPLPSVEENKE